MASVFIMWTTIMSWFGNIFSDKTFLTVISGVSVFVLGQTIQNFILKPIQEFYRVIGDISHKVKFHSNVLTSSGLKQGLIDWAAGDMRDLSCNLEASYIVIPFKTFLSKLKIMPTKNSIKESAKILIYLSNAGGQKESEIKNSDAIDKLKKYLNIEL